MVSTLVTWKDVNRKGVVRNGRGQRGGRDKSGAHIHEGGGRPWKVEEHKDEERMESWGVRTSPAPLLCLPRVSP